MVVEDRSGVRLLIPAAATISVTERDGIAVLSVSGEIDLTNNDELLDAIFWHSQARRGVVIDLTSVSFIDSPSLLALATAQRRYDTSGVDLAFIVGTANVKNPLDITGLYRTLRVIGD